MIEISKCKDKCFAELHSGCMILSDLEPECSPRCPFYKPMDCEDWIRREVGEEIWLIPPEEYAKSAEQK